MGICSSCGGPLNFNDECDTCGGAEEEQKESSGKIDDEEESF